MKNNKMGNYIYCKKLKELILLPNNYFKKFKCKKHKGFRQMSRKEIHQFMLDNSR